MPKLVSEISQGGSSERSVDGGTSADVRTRNWKIILNHPNEAYDIAEAIGVVVGDRHPVSFNLPCVSISERADGDSRVVRVVTATYRTTPGDADTGDGGGGGGGGNLSAPNIRPARFSITSSLIEVPAMEWRKIGQVWEPINPNRPFGNGEMQEGLGGVEEVLTPGTFDRIDGVTKLVPVINISIEQFDNLPTSRLDDAGKVNNDKFKFLGLDVEKYTCMLRNISVRPHVETWGRNIYRGFMRSYEFSIKTHGGWVVDQILEGFSVINNRLGDDDVDGNALSLEHTADGFIKEPRELAAGTQLQKVRASVLISSKSGGSMQRPSSMPVALNEDGTPRNVTTQEPPVLRRRYLVQGDANFGDNFANMGVRINEII